MKKEDVIKFCRYYNGEDDNPYPEGDKSLLWEYERLWVKLTLAKDVDTLGAYIDEYLYAGLSQFNDADGIPATLKALLFNRYCKWRSGTMSENVEPYKRWYLNIYE